MKPTKPKKSKLVLNREQIRNLTQAQLAEINGGLPRISPFTEHSLCDGFTLFCE